MHPRRILQATAVLLVLSACGLGGQASDTAVVTSPAAASVEPSPTSSWVTFASERHGYSIGHPADWRVREEPGSIRLAGMRVGSAGTDYIGDRDAFRFDTDDGVVVVSSHELEAGESLADFTNRVSREAACEDNGYGATETELDGEPAELRKFSCGTWDWIQVTAIHADRGYVVWLVTTLDPLPQDRPINDEFLASFQFTD